MSKWTFEPFVIRQYDSEFAGPFFAGPEFGFQIITAPNERGIALNLGWWTVQLTWIRTPIWPWCDVCKDYHSDYGDYEPILCPCGDPSCDYGW
jgi:hypothetical protein